MSRNEGLLGRVLSVRGGAWRRASGAALLVAVAGSLALAPAGCGGKGAAAGGTGAATVTSAEDLYAAGRYAEAKARAEVEYRKNDGTAKRRSALIAGMSAHASGKTAEARGWLEPLLNDPDPDISGRAAATLGLIAQNQKDPARAAELLTRASQQLAGDDAARAALRAGHAQTELNQFAQAKASYEAAMAAATTPALKAAIQPYTQPGPFSLQVGVFSTKPNADRKAQEVQVQAAKLGMGPTRVKAKPAAGGKPSFAVQMGRFLNRHAAVIAGGKLGTQAVVVPSDE